LTSASPTGPSGASHSGYLTDGQGFSSYLDGSFPCPDKAAHPRSHYIWNNNDRSLRAFMLKHVSTNDYDAVQKLGPQGAHAIYEALRKRHEELGSYAQVLLLRKAMDIRFDINKDLDETVRRSQGTLLSHYRHGGHRQGQPTDHNPYQRSRRSVPTAAVLHSGNVPATQLFLGDCHSTDSRGEHAHQTPRGAGAAAPPCVVHSTCCNNEGPLNLAYNLFQLQTTWSLGGFLHQARRQTSWADH
jgi:hypothetical protein